MLVLSRREYDEIVIGDPPVADGAVGPKVEVVEVPGHGMGSEAVFVTEAGGAEGCAPRPKTFPDSER